MVKGAPRVSVVMPAFNAATTIGAAVASALWQTSADLELVVVDDGSTDETAAIAAAHGDRVRVVSQPNAGVAAARNRGIAEARGDLIAFCDADDILFAQHLAALLEVHDRTGDLVTANAWWLFPNGIDRRRTRHKGRFPGRDEQRMSILQQNFVSTMTLFPRALVDEIGPFDESLRRAEDWDFWMRAVFAGHRVAHQPRPLALYRWGATSLSAGTDAMDAAVRDVLQKAAASLALTAEERAYVDRRLGGRDPREVTRDADRALRERRYGEAAALYRDAAALCPAERPLVWKARVLSAVPRLTGPAVRARQVRIEQALGIGAEHER